MNFRITYKDLFNSVLFSANNITSKQFNFKAQMILVSPQQAIIMYLGILERSGENDPVRLFQYYYFLYFF